MPVSFSQTGLAVLILLIVAVVGVCIIDAPILEGFFDATSRKAQRVCEEKYQSCINNGGQPEMCTSKYTECTSRAASKNPLVSKVDIPPTGDRDKQLSAPAALQKSGKIWAPNYTGLYRGLAEESRAAEPPPAEASWFQRVVRFFFPTEAFAVSKAQACEKAFQTCVRGGTSVLSCTETYNKCTGATEVAKSALQTISTSPLKDASGNPIKSPTRRYSLDTTTDPAYNTLKARDYSTLATLARLGQSDKTGYQKFLEEIAARVPTNQGIPEPTAAQLAAAQGAGDLQILDVPDYADYVANQEKQLPHQIPTPTRVQLVPQSQTQTQAYLLTPSLRQNVRQETKKMIQDIISGADNEYEIKYVYA